MSNDGDKSISDELKRSEEDRKGKRIAYSSQGEGEGDVVGVGGDVGSSSRGASSSGGGASSSGGGGGGGGASSSNIAEAEGPMFWTTGDERHRFGNVSTAVIQANRILEDFSQVEMGRTATFVGIYDGHGGHQAADYVSRTMTRVLMGCIKHAETMSADILREAFLRTEVSWQENVDARFTDDPYIDTYGTSCLVGVFWRGKLYLANAGDSRAVIARATEGSTEFNAVPLTRDDNVRYLEALHPDEPGFAVEDNDFPRVFHIKGRIQASKSIGDTYLKRARFNLNHLEKRFKLNSPVSDDNPALSADPSTYTISIGPQDRFVIFASRGFWDLMTNEKAIHIVQAFPKEGIGERLVKEALTEAATNIRRTYEELLLLRRDNGHRRRAHDDISVVVIFFDHTILARKIVRQENFGRHSIKQGSVSSEGQSSFTALDEVALAPPEIRTIFFRNLPYHTGFYTLYELTCTFGPIQFVQLGTHGLSAKIVFYDAQHALEFLNTNRVHLILKGKIACISAIQERRYRRTFDIIDHYYSGLKAPFSVHVANLTDHLITEEILGAFFTLLGLELSNYPLLYRRGRGRVYGYVTFTTVADRNRALLYDGMLLLHHHIEVHEMHLPNFVLRPVDLNPDNPF